jgi:cobalamin biosynthesis protein CobD/CbiB
VEVRPALGDGPSPDVVDIRRVVTLSAAVAAGAGALALLYTVTGPLRRRPR